MTKEKERDSISRCPYLSNTFLKIFDEYASKKLKKQRTKQRYEYVIYNICNFAKCDFLQLSKEQVEAYLKLVCKNETLKSTNYSLSVLRAISRYLDENAKFYNINSGYLELFSDLEIVFPDMYFKSEDIPSLSDVDCVLQYFKEQEDFVGFIACSLVLRTAMTISQIVELKKEMFFQDKNENYGIRIKLSNYAYGFTKIPEDIAVLIISYLEKRENESESLLLNKKGKPISIKALQNRLQEACSNCDIKPFTYNKLRTLSESYMIKAGAPLQKIAEYTNTKKTDWFFRYDKVVEELEDSAVDYVHIKVVW